MSDPAGKAREAIHDWLRRSSIRATDDSGYQILIQTLAESAVAHARLLATLVNRSASDRLSYDACAAAVEQLLKHEAPLPADLGRFVLEQLNDERERPGRRRHLVNLSRDLIVLSAIQTGLRVAPELKATRNVASDKESMCDIVSDCLRDYGVELKPGGVAKIFEKNTQLQPIFELLRSL